MELQRREASLKAHEGRCDPVDARFGTVRARAVAVLIEGVDEQHGRRAGLEHRSSFRDHDQILVAVLEHREIERQPLARPPAPADLAGMHRFFPHGVVTEQAARHCRRARNEGEQEACAELESRR